MLPAHAATTNFAADGNWNTVIDAGDYGVWRQNFGNTSGAGAGAAVPEPDTAILAALVAIALIPLGGRRR